MLANEDVDDLKLFRDPNIQVQDYPRLRQPRCPDR